MPNDPKDITNAPTQEELTEQLWSIVSAPNVDRTTAIAAVADILNTLQVDQEADEQAGRIPKGEPS